MFAEISRLCEMVIEDDAPVDQIDALAETKEWQLPIDKAMDKPVAAPTAAFHSRGVASHQLDGQPRRLMDPKPLCSVCA